MKKLYTIIMAAMLLAVVQRVNAQDGINDLFKASPSDVNKLMNGYTKPLFKGFGNGLNGGWSNTAKTQGFLKFAIRVSVTGSFVPDADKTYDLSKLGLSSNITYSNPIAPTFGGDKDAAAPTITFRDPSNPSPSAQYTTSLPKGVINIIPAPQVQLTVGLIKNTDVTLRLIPTTKISDDVGSLGMFGLGFKHNFTSDFGAAGKVMPFDLALAVGYTHLSYNKPLTVTPDAGNGGVSGNSDFSNQSLQGNFNGWNVQAIISKKLLFFTPFASVGYLTSTTDVGLKGNFPFVSGVTLTGKPTYTSYSDPITIDKNNASTSGMRADIGFQMSLFFLKLYASYSFAEYQSANAGIGLGF